MNIVWFNGPSAEFWLQTLHKQQVEIGCNYIYQDRRVDHVCVYDHQMLPLIKDGPHKLWCRNGIKDPRYEEVNYTARQQPHNSGAMAIRLAINLKLDHVFVLGCDWGITNKSRYDYGPRNSELKYTNSQKRLIERCQDEIDMTFITATRIDIDVPQASPDRLWSHVDPLK